MITYKIRLNSANAKTLAELLETYKTEYGYEIYVNAYILGNVKIYEVYRLNESRYDTCLHRTYNFYNLLGWLRKKLEKKWNK